MPDIYVALHQTPALKSETKPKKDLNIHSRLAIGDMTIGVCSVVWVPTLVAGRMEPPFSKLFSKVLTERPKDLGPGEFLKHQAFLSSC